MTYTTDSFSHRSGEQKFQIKVPADSIPGESWLPGLQIATCLMHTHMAFPLQHLWREKGSKWTLVSLLLRAPVLRIPRTEEPGSLQSMGHKKSDRTKGPTLPLLVLLNYGPNLLISLNLYFFYVPIYSHIKIPSPLMFNQLPLPPPLISNQVPLPSHLWH